MDPFHKTVKVSPFYVHPFYEVQMMLGEQIVTWQERDAAAREAAVEIDD